MLSGQSRVARSPNYSNKLFVFLFSNDVVKVRLY